MKKAIVMAISALSLAAFPSIAAAASPCPGAEVPPTASQDPKARSTLVCLINGERAKRGLRRLVTSSRLANAAIRHSDRMVAEGFYSHVDPAGETVEARIRGSGYLRSAWSWGIGENLAWGSGARSTPAATVAAWLASPAHRANLLMRDWREIGVGQAAGNPWGNLGATWAAEFGERIAKPKQARKKRKSRR